jgi:hypothetical protein
MSLQYRIHRSFPVAACGAVVLLCATSGSGANPTKPAAPAAAPATSNECVEAHTKAVERQQSGHLKEARPLFEACAKPTCDKYLQQECTTQVTQLDADIPSVVPVVTDGDDAPRVDCVVKIDGEVLTSKLGGQALSVDPGLHEFTFSTDKGVISTQKVMIVQGQRNRPLACSTLGPSHALSVSMPTQAAAAQAAAARFAYEKSASGEVAPAPPAPESSPKTKWAPGWAPWVVGGAGLAGVGAGALLIYWGRQDNNSLIANCPNGGCAQSAVSHVSTMYVAGDVLLGAGLAAVGVSTVWLLFGSRTSVENGEKSPAPAEARLKFDVTPARSGAFATVSGAF